MTPLRALLVPALLWAASTGCGSPRTLILDRGPEQIEAMLAARPPDPGRNITPYLLEASEHSSRHLIWVRDGESPHLHASHDLVVTILQGSGTLWLRGQPIPMRPGDTAAVAAGTPHHFVNGGSEPAAAFVVFAPPSDGSDNVPLSP